MTNEYDGLYAGAAAVERFRHRNIAPLSRTPEQQRTARAKAALAEDAPIPGDLSAEEIDKIMADALAVMKWGRRVGTP